MAVEDCPARHRVEDDESLLRRYKASQFDVQARIWKLAREQIANQRVTRTSTSAVTHRSMVGRRLLRNHPEFAALPVSVAPMARCKTSKSTGFTMCASKPAARVRAMSSACPYPVRAISRMPLEVLRMRLAT